MGNANLKELPPLDLGFNFKVGQHRGKADVHVQRAAAWKSTGIVALRDEGLQVIPDPIFALGPVVRSLDASGNRIERLPNDGLGMLVSLQRLSLVGNQLSVVPSSVGLLTSLKVLALDSNKLQSLPPQIGGCERLEQLSLSQNQLVSLPQTLSSLQKLSILDLSRNKLHSLPASIGHLRSLQELRANGNKLEFLPGSITELQELLVLNLDNNQISKLPPKIFSGCVKLRSLALESNPLSIETIREMEDYDAFEARRKGVVDKQLAGNVMLNL